MPTIVDYIQTMGGTVIEKILAGAFLGSIVVASRHMMNAGVTDFGDIDTSTENVAQDPQFVEVLMYLRVDQATEYVNLVRLAEDIVRLYRRHIQNIAENQVCLSSQLKMQGLFNKVAPLVKQYRKEVQTVAPEELETIEEHLITFEAVCQSYLDNIYQDSMNVVGGDSLAFENIERHVEGLV